MYHFSRALYRDLKPRVLPDPHQPGAVERRLLMACEATVERLATDRRYFARPARSLFSEVRYLFGPPDQLPVYERIVERISEAQRFLDAAEREGSSAYLLRCRATTRRGRACQRIPLPASRYCPSHRHLERGASAGDPRAW